MKIRMLITAAALFASLTTLLAAPMTVLARSDFPAPNWDRGLALETASAPRAEAQVRELYSLLRSGSHEALRSRLEALVAGSGLSQPERDAILFRFTTGLADFDDIDQEIIDRLKAVTPAVWVPHPERASVGVPLYDIAGAAEGVYQYQLRRASRAQAASGVEGMPAPWVDDYLAGTRAERMGGVDALGVASDAALSGLLAESLGRLPSAPELTPVAGKAALLLGDAAALERVVATGEGPELAYILEAAGTLMPAESNLALLAHAIAAAPASTAALAIAQLFPHLKADPAATRLLLSKLGDPELGGAAALALANAGTPQALVGLREAANSGEGLAASRAQTALGMGLQYGEADQ